MTTIVITADEIAWESMQVLGEGTRNVSPIEKVRMVRRGVVMAFCGNVNCETRVWRWLKRGGHPDRFPKFDPKKDDFEAVIIRSDGTLISYSEVCPDGAPVSAPYAIGSGAHYALGALEAFKLTAHVPSVTLAVQAAINLDVGSGGEIKSARIADLLKPKRKKP